MESLNKSCAVRRNLVEEDGNISKFRRRNKIIILVFFFLIISSALIIAALILELTRIHNYRTGGTEKVVQFSKSPIRSFCSVSDSPIDCFAALNPIINDSLVVDPDQIFTFSLQLAVIEIQNIVNSSEFALNNCSRKLRHGLSQLGGLFETMRVNPFVLSQGSEERREIMKRIVAAVEDLRSCNEDLANIEESDATGAAAAEKLRVVEEYLIYAYTFVRLYMKVLHKWNSNYVITASYYHRGLIYDNLFSIGMCGLQLIFMLGMFCALFRIR